MKDTILQMAPREYYGALVSILTPLMVFPVSQKAYAVADMRETEKMRNQGNGSWKKEGKGNTRG